MASERDEEGEKLGRVRGRSRETALEGAGGSPVDDDDGSVTGGQADNKQRVGGQPKAELSFRLSLVLDRCLSAFR